MTDRTFLEPESVGISGTRAEEVTGGRWEGPADFVIFGVAPVDEAGPEELGFLANRRYLHRARHSHAGGFLVSDALASELDGPERPLLRCEDPHDALRHLLETLFPDASAAPAIHHTAVLGRGVKLGENVSVGPYAVLEEGVEVGDGCRIGSHCVLGRGARLGPECLLHPHVVLYPEVRLGKRVIVHAGARLGVDGFGYVLEDGVHQKVPQVGACRIDDDVEIGANSCVDRGSIGTTQVGPGTKMDNLVHLGHNVRVGSGSILVAQVGVAGSTRIGEGVMVGGQAGLGGHIEVGSGARIGAQAGVISDVEAGETLSGYPARDHRQYLRGMAGVLRLPHLFRRVRALEARIGAGEAGAEPEEDRGPGKEEAGDEKQP